MATTEFSRADPVVDRTALIALNVEYLSWVFAGIETEFGVPADEVAGMPVAAYVPTVIAKVCGDAPPRGVFYLLRVDGELAGMGGLRTLGNGAAEIKRLYVRPAFRGLKLGEQLFERLLSDARAFGNHTVYLDSGLFMTAAHRLYEQHGFTDCPAYAGVELPPAFHGSWRFMHLQLHSPPGRSTA